MWLSAGCPEPAAVEGVLPERFRELDFRVDGRVAGTDKQQKTGYGNAVAPNRAEVLGPALGEAITAPASTAA